MTIEVYEDQPSLSGTNIRNGEHLTVQISGRGRGPDYPGLGRIFNQLSNSAIIPEVWVMESCTLDSLSFLSGAVSSLKLLRAGAMNLEGLITVKSLVSVKQCRIKSFLPLAQSQIENLHCSVPGTALWAEICELVTLRDLRVVSFKEKSVSWHRPIDTLSFDDCRMEQLSVKGVERLTLVKCSKLKSLDVVAKRAVIVNSCGRLDLGVVSHIEAPQIVVYGFHSTRSLSPLMHPPLTRIQIAKSMDGFVDLAVAFRREFGLQAVLLEGESNDLIQKISNYEVHACISNGVVAYRRGAQVEIDEFYSCLNDEL